jgi:hypothetical protein
MRVTPLNVIVLLLVLGLPVAWAVSEFRYGRRVRICLGIGSILMSFGVASLVGLLERFNSNAWFGYASKRLIDAAVSELDAGHSERVLQAFRQLQSQYEPTYENRARYDDLVDQAVAGMKSK